MACLNLKNGDGCIFTANGLKARTTNTAMHVRNLQVSLRGETRSKEANPFKKLIQHRDLKVVESKITLLFYFKYIGFNWFVKEVRVAQKGAFLHTQL